MYLLKIELLKIKKFSLIQLAILLPIPAIVIAVQILIELNNEVGGVTAVEDIMGISSAMYFGMFLPILIMYVVCSITKIENNNNGWKQLLTMPIKKWKIYFSKNLISMLIVAVSLISYYIYCLITSYLLTGKIYVEVSTLIKLMEVFLTILPIIILLFAVARIFNSIVVPLGVGIFFILSTIFIAQSEYWLFAPWAYPVVFSGGAISSKENILILLVSVVLCGILFLSDLYKFTTKDVI